MPGFTFPLSEIAPHQSEITTILLLKLDHVIDAMTEAKTALICHQIEQRFNATQEVNKGLDEMNALLIQFASPSLYGAFESTLIKVTASNIRVNVSQCESSAEEALAALQGFRTVWTTLHPGCEVQAFQMAKGEDLVAAPEHRLLV